MNENICPLSGQPCSEQKNFQITEISNGKKQEFNLCQNCAKNYMSGKRPKERMPTVKRETSGSQLIDFLKRLGISLEAPEEKEKKEVKEEIKKEIKCKHCEKTLSQVKLEGHLGCDYCYATFGPLTLKELRKITGERPKKQDKIKKKPKTIEDFIANLESNLKYLIKKEDYEEAAKVRDKITSSKAILEKVDSVRIKIKELVALERFEEAAKVKKELDEIIKNCIS